MDTIDLTAKYTEEDAPLRRLKSVDTIVVHRIALGDTGEAVGDAFLDEDGAGAWTGAHVPYHFVVGRQGVIWQLLPLSVSGPHAKEWNRRSVGVAFIGDFREDKTPGAQRAWGLVLIRNLMGTLGVGISHVKGHDELPGGSSDPNKECPGRLFRLDEFRSQLVYGLVL